MPFVPIRERSKGQVEEHFGCEYELFVEFTGLISWCKGASIGWHRESGSSDSMLLPWVPGVFQDLELEASGGCAMSSSDYKWFSSDVAAVSVSASGIVQAKKPGRATIQAVSISDPLNYDEMVVEVTLPSSMVMLPGFPAEASVGTYLQASVTLKAPMLE
ncbi:hypothetical protein F511_39410 [Dorcoceras hygrometricum]|uniref:BIG2 domain-containing protein n=1 Tax=Dorcoceras hygrometricum TaxID=472368 RepID=A0A2Z7BN86_9LAMI|nr:hypothetical protein F511_39410 [Dorcoceras hygrometricum]